MILCPGTDRAAAETPTTITVYERTSQTLKRTAALVTGDEVHLPMELLVGYMGLQRKGLTGGKVGVCRGDVCVPLSVGKGPGMVRRIGDKEFVPVEPVVTALRGIKSWDVQESDLLLDLARRPDSPKTMIGVELDLVLPDLTGRPVSISALRGKKILLFAWASW